METNIKTDSVFDLILMIAKKCIFRCKISKINPDINFFKSEVQIRYKIDEYNAKMNFSTYAFHMQWLQYKDIFNIGI